MVYLTAYPNYKSKAVNHINMPKESYNDQINQNPSESPVSVGGGRKKKPRRLLASVLNIILILAVVALGYGYYTKKKELDTIKDPAAQAEVARKEAETVAAQAGKIVLLPEGEEIPEVLTINDAALAIKEQPNLAGVVTGDKIILYVKSGKAIVYSPSRNIIVNILPVVLQRPQGQAAGTSNQQNSSASQGSRSTSSSASDE